MKRKWSKGMSVKGVMRSAKQVKLKQSFDLLGYDTFYVIRSRLSLIAITYLLVRRIQNLLKKYEKKEQRGFRIYHQAIMNLSKCTSKSKILTILLLQDNNLNKYYLKHMGLKFDFSDETYKKIDRYSAQDVRDVRDKHNPYYAKHIHKTLQSEMPNDYMYTPEYEGVGKHHVNHGTLRRTIDPWLESGS